MTIEQQIAKLQSQLVWFRNETFANKTVEMINDEIKRLQQELVKPSIKVLDIPA